MEYFRNKENQLKNITTAAKRERQMGMDEKKRLHDSCIEENKRQLDAFMENKERQMGGVKRLHDIDEMLDDNEMTRESDDSDCW